MSRLQIRHPGLRWRNLWLLPGQTDCYLADDDPKKLWLGEEEMLLLVGENLFARFCCGRDATRAPSPEEPQFLAQGLQLVEQGDDGADGRPVHAVLLPEMFDVAQSDHGFLIELPLILDVLDGTNHAFAAVKNNFSP